MPPLSPSVQQNVDTIVQNLVNVHAGETIVYSNCSGTQCFRQCILRVRVKNGVVTGFDNDDSINQGIGMEDQYMSWSDVLNLKTQSRTCPMSFGFLAMLNNPDRVIYPMQRVGPGSGQWQRIATDTAISAVAQWLQDTKNTYGPYSIFFDAYSALGAGNMPFGDAFGAGVTGWDAYSMNGGMEPNWWVLGEARLVRVLEIGTTSPIPSS